MSKQQMEYACTLLADLNFSPIILQVALIHAWTGGKIVGYGHHVMACFNSTV